MTKKSFVLGAAMAAAFTGSAFTTTAANAEFTANIGAASQYYWRGTSLSASAPAVSGGVDYGHESGFYAGIWTSSEGAYGGPETDFYLGFGGEVEGISYDVGFISYKYFQQESLGFGTTNDFEEVYLGLGYGPVGFSYAVDSDNETTYLTLSGEFAGVGLTYGDYTFDLSPASDYSHIDISYGLTDELSILYSMPDTDAAGAIDDPIFVIMYGLEFELK